jgi:hypothetical protein
MKQNFHTRFIAFGIFGVFLLLANISTSVGVNALGVGTSSVMPVVASSVTPVPSPTPTATLTIEERLTHLEETVALPKKDWWDKGKIVADILIAIAAGIVLTGFSIWATNSFNKQQLQAEDIRSEAQRNSEELRAKNQIASEEQRAKEQKQIQEIQTVQSFMPQLQSNDPRAVKAAILAITSLGNEKMGAQLAELFQNEGSLAALQKMAISGNEKIAEAAEHSLNEIYKQVVRNIVQISQSGNVRGTGFFVHHSGYIITTQNTISGQGEIVVVIDSKTLPAKVVKSSEQDNLALLKVEGQGFGTLSTSNSGAIPEMLEEITLIGYDIRVGIALSIGKFAGITHTSEYPNELISINVIAPRSYGGAVAFDKTGQLLGLVVLMWLDESKLANTVYVLPVSSLLEFFRELTPK